VTEINVRAQLLFPFFIAFATLVLVFALMPPTYAPGASGYELEINATTGKGLYNLGEDIPIYGNLTLNGSLVQDGLVALQVNNPSNGPVAIRTMSTGVFSANWTLQILEVVPSDEQGNPKDSFARGTLAYFKATVRNTGTISRDVTLVFNVYDVNMVTLGVVVALGPITVPPGMMDINSGSFPIRYTAALGEATVCVNAYNRLPEDFGTPYCPEKSATFTIPDGQTLGEPTPGSPTVYSAHPEGNFNSIFKLPSFDGGKLGVYAVYLTSSYLGELAISFLTFKVELKGDLNDDLTVDIYDVVIVALAFGSYSGNPNWNPVADLNEDEIVDIYDVVAVALDFGKTAG